MDMETEIAEPVSGIVVSEPVASQFEYGCENDLNTLIKKVKRLEVLSYILIFLIAVSIAVSIIPMFKDRAAPGDLKALPASLDKTELINKIQDAYNKQDTEKIYNFLGELAKQKIPLDALKKSFEKLFPVLGKLNEVSFSSYEYLGNQEGLDWFKLTYNGIYDTGKGEVFVTIVVDNDGKWEVASIYFNLNYAKQ